MSGTSFRDKIIKNQIIKNDVNVLDIGCGPATILESLPRVNYFGFDINSNYINYAKNKYQGSGNFFCKKLTNKDLKTLPKFDHVLLLGVLHHLSDSEVLNLLSIIKKLLKKNGNVITEDPIFIKNQNLISKFIIKRDRGNNVRDKENYIKLIKRKFKHVKSTIYHQKFIPYTWFVMIFKK